MQDFRLGRGQIGITLLQYRSGASSRTLYFIFIFSPLLRCHHLQSSFALAVNHTVSLHNTTPTIFSSWLLTQNSPGCKVITVIETPRKGYNSLIIIMCILYWTFRLVFYITILSSLSSKCITWPDVFLWRVETPMEWKRKRRRSRVATVPHWLASADSSTLSRTRLQNERLNYIPTI